jgi:dolichol-phosphate mannosyltransferase
MSSLVVVPTYNEADNLPSIVGQVLEMEGFQLLVVDDNSPDGTGELAEGLKGRYGDRLEVLHRPGKLGLGTAYLEGFRMALGRRHSFIFQMDADFSHDPADLPRLLAELRGGADLAIGSRYVPGGGTPGWPLWRLAMSRGGSLYAGLVLGMGIRDLTGGYRGWRRQALRDIGLDSVRSEGFAFQVEMAYRCVRKGRRIVEIPIQFSERRSGSSKMSTKIFMEAAATVWRLRIENADLPYPMRQLLLGR